MARWRDDDANDSDWSVVFAPGEKFRGTRGNDRLTGTDQADVFRIRQGGDDHVNAAQGQDIIYVGASLTADDRITGGAGEDTLVLEGDYASGLTLQTNTISRIEHMVLRGEFDYDITLAPDMRHDFGSLVVDATSAQSLLLDGSAVNFALNVLGGGGDDILIGGSGFNGISPRGGHDVMTGGVGEDQYNFFATSDSLPSNGDVVTNFNDDVDQIALFEIDADTQKNGHQYFHFGATPGTPATLLLPTILARTSRLSMCSLTATPFPKW